jgi:hypothetical protein
VVQRISLDRLSTAIREAGSAQTKTRSPRTTGEAFDQLGIGAAQTGFVGSRFTGGFASG